VLVTTQAAVLVGPRVGGGRDRAHPVLFTVDHVLAAGPTLVRTV